MRLGGYELQGELGRGGMSVVYRARAVDGRVVALKVVAPPDAAAVAAFERERRLLASFGEEEGFVPLLDAGAEQGRLWFAMPLIEGGTLKERLAAQGALPPDAAVALVRELAAALARAHERGVVHRDLKPANVLFTRRGKWGDWGRALVADLGVAKHYRRDVAGASASLSHTQAGTVLGTVGYMAPELIDDAKHAGPPCDVFALGVILHEAVAGSKPFPSGGLLEYVKALRRPPRPLRADAKGAPAWLEDVVARALDVDPARRFPDAGAFARALDSGAKARRSGWRRPVAGGGLLLALAGVAAALAQLRPAPPPRIRPTPPAPAAPSPPPERDAVTAIVSRTEQHLHASELELARDCATQGLALAPSNARLLRMRGLARHELRDHAGALEDFERVVTLAPRSAEALHDRAACRWALGDFDGALVDLDLAVELDPRRTKTLTERARLRLGRGDYDGAADDCSRAIDVDPTLPRAWRMRALLRVRSRRFREGRADATRSLELDPLDGATWRVRSSARLLGDEDAAGAIADATRAIELPGPKGDARVARAEARTARGDFEGALDDYDEALGDGVVPEDLRGYEPVRAKLRRERRAPDEASRAKARELAAASDAALNDANSAAALELTTRALLLDLRVGEAWRHRASARLNLGHPHEEVLADAARAVDLEPDQPKAWAMRGVARLKLADLDGTLSDATRVLALDPTDVTGLLLRSEVRERRGDLHGAIEDVEHAIAKMPSEFPRAREPLERRLDAMRARLGSPR